MFQKYITCSVHKIQTKIFSSTSSNKHWVSKKRHPLISAAPLGIQTEISTAPLISAAPLNAALIRIVSIFY